MNAAPLVMLSTLLFITTSLLETLLHEMAHAIAASLAGAQPILYHTSVWYDLSDPQARILVASAGPAMSLVIGLAAHAALTRTTMSATVRLATFYLAAFGYIGVLGYVAVAPMFAYGDTGFVLRALDVPLWGIIIIAIAGAILLYGAVRSLAVHVMRCMTDDVASDRPLRARFVNAAIMLPLIVGTVVVALLNLPAPTVLSLIAPVCTPFTLMWVYDRYLEQGSATLSAVRLDVVSATAWIWATLACTTMVIINRMLVPGITIGILLLCAAPSLLAAPPRRPAALAAASPSELRLTTTLVRADSRWTSAMRFVSVQVREPEKRRVLQHDTALHREMFCVVMDMAAHAVYEVYVDATTREVSEWRRVVGVEPSLIADDFVLMDSIVRADKRWNAAIARRRLTPDQVYIDGWASGIAASSFNTRLMRTVTYARNGSAQTFDRPLEGIETLVDLTRRVVMEFSDRPKAPVPEPSTQPGALQRIAARSRIASVQPTDDRAEVRGDEVQWRQWRFRIGVHAREGLTLTSVRVHDGDTDRPLIYRMNLAEMVVPYGDTTLNWFWRAAFDVGEYGLGQLSSSLKPGVDAPSNATFLPAAFVTPSGEVVVRKNVVAVYERDAGILWRHDSGNDVVGRRDRELVVMHVATVGNYDYSIGYVFGLDGSLRTEVQLTGLLLPKAVQDTVISGESTAQMFGGLVQRNVLAPAHQHFFCFRIDTDVDDTANVMVEMDLRQPSGSENRFLNGILMDAYDFHYEQEACRSMSMDHARSWVIRSASEKNALGGPTGYMLMPGANAVPYIMSGTWVRNRARFIDHHVWSTRYHDGELYPAGAYPNQSSAGEGLPAYIKNNESINGKDLVLWYTMGVSHFPRPEEWPIMSAHRASFTLVPNGFWSKNPTATEKATSSTTKRK